jgi:hypothetical protein
MEAEREIEGESVRKTNFVARRAVSPGVFGAPLFEEVGELRDRERQKETERETRIEIERGRECA